MTAKTLGSRVLELSTDVSEPLRRIQRMNEAGNSELELVALFRMGNRDAFTALYHAHHAAILRFGYHMTGDQTKATDLTQDVFVWLVRHPHAFAPERGGLAAFLLGVARKLMQRKWREERRWLPLDDVPEQALIQEDSRQAASPEHAIDAGLLRRAIALLPVKYREVIVLCELEGKSYEDTARSLRCAVGTVRSRLHRARELLARKLKLQIDAKRVTL